MTEHISRRDAKAKGLRHYFTGTPCKHGHVSKRLVSTKMCCECSKLHRRRYVETNFEQVVRLQREGDLRRLYGITQADFLWMFEEQSGCCAICTNTFKSTPHIDHCHTTGKVRGLLCSNCNTALGLMQDSPELLLRAAAYVVRP